MRCTANHLSCGSTSCWVHNCSLRGQRKYMKANNTRQAPMPDCEVQFLAEAKTPAGRDKVMPLVHLIAQVLDAAVSGQDVNLRIGATRNKSAFIVTLYQDNEASYASGVNWDTLLEQVALLL